MGIGPWPCQPPSSFVPDDRLLFSSSLTRENLVPICKGRQRIIPWKKKKINEFNNTVRFGSLPCCPRVNYLIIMQKLSVSVRSIMWSSNMDKVRATQSVYMNHDFPFLVNNFVRSPKLNHVIELNSTNTSTHYDG